MTTPSRPTRISSLASARSRPAGPEVPSPSAAETLAKLKQQIRAVELGVPELGATGEGADAGSTADVISTGVVALDRWLPAGGHQRGSLIEWLVPGQSGAGYGAEGWSLSVARRAAAAGGVIVVVDPGHEFYPPAAKNWGIDLHRLVILRSQRCQDVYWSIDQALRSPAVAAVWGAASAAAPWFLVDLPERWYRRFQLSAEAGGALGLFVRPESVARQPSWCDVQWHLKPTRTASPTTSHRSPDGAPTATRTASASIADVMLPADYWHRRLTVQLLRCRGGRAGQTWTGGWDTRTGEWFSNPALPSWRSSASTAQMAPELQSSDSAGLNSGATAASASSSLPPEIPSPAARRRGG